MKKIKFVALCAFFGQQIVFGMCDIEKQTDRCRFRNKRAATNYFMSYLKNRSFNIYSIELDDQNNEQYCFSIKKYIIEKCEALIRFLCFENK